MRSIRQSLSYGEFYGTQNVSREIPGFSLALIDPVLRPEDVPLHTHEDATLVFLLAGQYISSAADSGSECGPSTLIFNPPQTTHRDRFKTLAGRFLAISVSREAFRNIADDATLPTVARSFTPADVISTAYRLACECQRWHPDSALVTEGICLELLGKIALHVPQFRGKPPTWLHKAKELLHDRCAEQLRIAAAARLIGVHPVHLARSFRHFHRCAPGEYLTRCRLEKALSMLRETKVSLSEAALQAGFFDQSHFSRTFKQHFGITPRAYKKTLGHGSRKLRISSLR